MKLTVVIPVKDRARLLGCTLDSLLRAARYASAEAPAHTVVSEGPHYSVVVVDNGSSDNSLEVARSHPVVTLALQSAASTVAAVRNEGAATAADADAIVFLDCDCEVPPNFLTSVVDAFERSGAAAVGCEVRSREDGHWTERTWDRLHRPNGDGPRHYINSACFCIRREWFERIRGFDSALGSSEDVDISRRLIQSGGTLWQSESLAVLHLGNPQSLVGLYRRICWHGSGVWPPGKSFQWSLTSIATLMFGISSLTGFSLAALLFAHGEFGQGLASTCVGILLVPVLFVAARAWQFRRPVPVVSGVALMMLTFTARLEGLASGRWARTEKR